uniref:Uncharacterized protein n=1 Tax=Steinernema glaseri TaxID=37863 RepID=A0A1I8AAU1_9BILA
MPLDVTHMCESLWLALPVSSSVMWRNIWQEGLREWGNGNMTCRNFLDREDRLLDRLFSENVEARSSAVACIQIVLTVWPTIPYLLLFLPLS